jgi:hypothetical protein
MLKFLLKTIEKPLNLSKGIIKFLIAVIVILFIILYYQTEIFYFSEVKNNAGNNFYNPYASWNKLKTVKANFHAHAHHWGGLTNGHNSEKELTEAYKNIGYQVASVSNYHHISKSTCSDIIQIPTYEQGYNISKAHFLAINAMKTENIDFPIGQNTTQKQTRIKNLKTTASLVAIAHPKLNNAFSKKDLEALKGYDLLEVLNPYCESFDLWDYALSRGTLSWLLSNDDTHDLAKQPPGRFFNVVSIKESKKNAIINSLKEGNHVAYKSEKGVTDVYLNKINIKNNTLEYTFSGKIKSVKMISDLNSSMVPSKGEIQLKNDFKYFRFEVIGEFSTLFTNPIYRIDEKKLTTYSSIPYKISKSKTFIFRLNCLLVGSIFIVLIYWKEIYYKVLNSKSKSQFSKKKSLILSK